MDKRFGPAGFLLFFLCTHTNALLSRYPYIGFSALVSRLTTTTSPRADAKRMRRSRPATTTEISGPQMRSSHPAATLLSTSFRSLCQSIAFDLSIQRPFGDPITMSCTNAILLNRPATRTTAGSSPPRQIDPRLPFHPNAPCIQPSDAEHSNLLLVDGPRQSNPVAVRTTTQAHASRKKSRVNGCSEYQHVWIPSARS